MMAVVEIEAMTKDKVEEVNLTMIKAEETIREEESTMMADREVEPAKIEAMNKFTRLEMMGKTDTTRKGKDFHKV